MFPMRPVSKWMCWRATSASPVRFSASKRPTCAYPTIRVAPTAQQFLVLDGLARVDGFELGAAGKVTDKWQVIGGYSYLDSSIPKTRNLAELDRWLPNAPHHNLSVWTTYDVTPKLTVGAGATYQSDAFVNTTNTAFVPEYWKFDAMVSYKVDNKSTIQLNVYNITDEFYYCAILPRPCGAGIRPLGVALLPRAVVSERGQAVDDGPCAERADARTGRALS